MAEDKNIKDVYINVTGVSITGTGELRTDEPIRHIEADTKNLKERKQQIANDMVEGRMSDHIQYQKAVGIAEGLEQPLR